MDVRTLEGTGWDELAATFTAAFSDYAVPMTMTGEALARMQERRGYVASASFGAFAGGQMIGFVLTCRDGDRAYNSGTGVIPSHRRHRVARALIDAVIATVARSYVLEVLAENTKAIAFYRSVGFVERRRLRCWTFDHPGAPLPELAAPNLAAIARDAEVELAWQNSLASIARAPEPWTAIGDEHGAAVVFPGSADLPLLVVRRADRRRGHGGRLLGAAAALASRPLRILNIDARADGIAAFLASAGARPLVEQLELVREIS